MFSHFKLGVSLLSTNIIIATLLISLPANYASAVTTLCNPKLDTTWQYDPVTNSSSTLEKSKDLSAITLSFDLGFLKLSRKDQINSEVFRQIVINRIEEDKLNFIIKYEDILKGEIKKSFAIISDPMCKSRKFVTVNIFEIEEMGFHNTAYNCDCISMLHGRNVFMYPN